MHLRQSIIDDEIWQAVQPYGPFLLLQLLVFPELICAADQELCAYVCVSQRERERERDSVSVCHYCLCPQALHEHLSIPQYVRLQNENRKLFHRSTAMRTCGHKANGECQKLGENDKARHESEQPCGDGHRPESSLSYQSNIKCSHFRDLISPWI